MLSRCQFPFSIFPHPTCPHLGQWVRYPLPLSMVSLLVSEQTLTELSGCTLRIQLHLTLGFRQFQCCHEHRLRIQVRRAERERIQSLKRSRQWLGEVTRDRAHFGSGTRMASGGGRPLVGIARFRLRKAFHRYRNHSARTPSLKGKAYAGKLLVVQLGKGPSYLEGNLGGRV